MELIPKQIIGKKYDTVYSMTFKNSLLAKQKYQSASKKLLHINGWGFVSKNTLDTDFFLCNNQGKKVYRYPLINDYIKIDLVGPGSTLGAGYDWVKIEQIIIKEEEDDASFISIRVRPASSPINADESIAHFFDDKATSTFIVSRKKNIVKAEIHGRNEIPNNSSSNLLDNIRNALVAKAANIKFSDVQWNNLCKGFLS